MSGQAENLSMPAELAAEVEEWLSRNGATVELLADDKAAFATLRKVLAVSPYAAD